MWRVPPINYWSFQEIDRKFKNSNAIEQHNFNLQAIARAIELTTSKQVRRVGSSIELPTHRKKVRSC
ncbi:hypothetical protein QUA00_01205 [Microcoleus sp. T2B6]|uniref:hypothetical protein n=1 Tax=Microcoleus sp. T2B6 TaxID=3055424 RepID=UPI002FD4ED70